MSSERGIPTERPRLEEAQSTLPGLFEVAGNIQSIRQLLVIAGVGAFLFGAVIYIFIRDLAGPALIMLGIGALLLVVAAAIGWRQVARALFGRRGRYGANTLLILIAFVAIAVVLNYFLFWLANRPQPFGWLRVDTTATKHFILSDQAIAVLDTLKDDVRANAFFVTDTAAGSARWRETRDLLSEFKRRSNGKFDFRLIDPELEPNQAAAYGVSQYPAIALEQFASRRTQVIVGDQSAKTTRVFTEQDITQGLLVVNQIRQKSVLFVTGHGEHDPTDFSTGADGYGQAVEALTRDNYHVGSVTVQELGLLMLTSKPEDFPAAIVFAGPKEDLLTGGDIDEDVIIREYLRAGGNALFLLEPGAPQTFIDLIGHYGMTLGAGQVVDTASFVAPSPNFLQVKRVNGQFVADHPITAPLDVLYMPGTAFIGSTVSPDTVPLTAEGRPYVQQTPLVVSTISSWAETGDSIEFDRNTEQGGPLPLAVAVQAIAELDSAPQKDKSGSYISTNLVVIGDSDFASNRYFSSAKNGDLLANSINWLVRDYQLISIRPKTRAFRELVLTKNERDFVRYTGWLLMPVLIGSVGVFSWWRRR